VIPLASSSILEDLKGDMEDRFGALENKDYTCNAVSQGYGNGTKYYLVDKSQPQ
jgi:hypothetical protein